MPCLPISICDQTFKRAVGFLDAIGYTGPVSISCDDTKLLSKLSPYYDDKTSQWFILGGVGEPVTVDRDEEDIEKMLACAVGNKEKATKVRER